MTSSAIAELETPSHVTCNDLLGSMCILSQHLKPCKPKCYERHQVNGYKSRDIVETSKRKGNKWS